MIQLVQDSLSSLLVGLGIVFPIAVSLRYIDVLEKDWNKVVLGLVLGIAAIAAQVFGSFPLPGASGVGDGRNVFVALSGYLAGGYGALFAALLASLARLYTGGSAAVGIAGILFVAFGGYLFGRLRPQKVGSIPYRDLLLLAITAVAANLLGIGTSPSSSILPPSWAICTLLRAWLQSCSFFTVSES